MSISNRAFLAVLLPLLAGCEQGAELLGLPNPEKEAAAAVAESKAIGGACRLAGRSLEDCYILNPVAQKAAVLTGWKEMNDYMTEKSVEAIPSQLPSPNLLLRPQVAETAAAGEEAAATADEADPQAEDEPPRRRPRRGAGPIPASGGRVRPAQAAP